MVAMIEVEDLTDQASARSEVLADRLFQSTLATMDTALVHLGNRLGLYQALSDIEPATSDEVAQAAGLHERYVREWLEQQTVSGFLDCDNPQASAAWQRIPSKVSAGKPGQSGNAIVCLTASACSGASPR